MDINLNARNAEIHPRFREYVEEKVSKVSHFYPGATAVNVELTHERNPRQADTAEKIEITVFGKGPVIRAEASSADRYAAVDLAVGKLFERLRRARDRAKDHRRRYQAETPVDLGAFEITMPEDEGVEDQAALEQHELKVGEAVEEQLGDSPVIVRQKLHEADRMTVDQALYQMELVGHPFFLFIDADTGQPCVVYHRHGWTYGVLRLNAVVAE
ncbi:ribosomal subunit interface protein [Boudabousia liubingyangii]|uniref:Ribosome hibernation promoting factor n=1 Tax=Boudabousia liubingyangii TaxID=1921764 RepID=A0A1Q5PKX4_9ACTO|nr:ribosome-associated translation inhibitor RaiA [Boudabousia liubingyangii]OKL46398.1 ribosomal subunit interface protein [Boudabousia liubingyangii]OKL47280.1 ribosomal subunit interface protein [Boudabousia liubingyangii]